MGGFGCLFGSPWQKEKSIFEGAHLINMCIKAPLRRSKRELDNINITSPCTQHILATQGGLSGHTLIPR